MAAVVNAAMTSGVGGGADMAGLQGRDEWRKAKEP